MNVKTITSGLVIGFMLGLSFATFCPTYGLADLTRNRQLAIDASRQARSDLEKAERSVEGLRQSLAIANERSRSLEDTIRNRLGGAITSSKRVTYKIGIAQTELDGVSAILKGIRDCLEEVRRGR